MASNRILCPFHEETTPSLVVYENGYKCFGCGKRGSLSELPNNIEKPKPVGLEDIHASLRHINLLPKKTIRGLDLPFDLDGYYIVFPNDAYYKKRLYDSNTKYYSPRGLQKPLFKAIDDPKNTKIMIVEGELNAMSIAQVIESGTNICSPGSATDFFSYNSIKSLPYYTKHSKIKLIVDKDKAGASAALKLRTELLKYTPYVYILLMDVDANDRLVKSGKEELAEVVMSGWL